MSYLIASLYKYELKLLFVELKIELIFPMNSNRIQFKVCMKMGKNLSIVQSIHLIIDQIIGS